ncbi:protein FMC1 homolog [Frankliniella occidentalis]|uniref:Protein FMC1 homolog n=1 Tax=Frankliniella occidentalis TaxID=133901 RepID=A0A9C6UAD8_FRAOC|nr:protein FMC1 homolog [Frankliniella occidentalis]
MNSPTAGKVLKQLASEVRLHSSHPKICSDSQLMKYILSQYERYKVTDQQLCKAQEEMSSLAKTYLCYLQSTRRTAEIRQVYKGKGERSVQETADMVGFKLPHDPK